MSASTAFDRWSEDASLDLHQPYRKTTGRMVLPIKELPCSDDAIGAYSARFTVSGVLPRPTHLFRDKQPAALHTSAVETIQRLMRLMRRDDSLRQTDLCLSNRSRTLLAGASSALWDITNLPATKAGGLSPTEIAERLEDAKKELDGVRAEAEEEGYPVPSVELVDRVGNLLDRLVTAQPHWYSIYPMEDGEIAIHASNEPTGAVLITCRPYDTWCVVSIGKSRRRAWFESMDELPDPFTHKALRDLAG